MARPKKMFTVGTQVRWTSQAGGYRKTKVGIIVDVIPAFDYLTDYLPDEILEQLGRGHLPRTHESYIVRVGNKYYWPRVKNLEVIS
jgi:hypothetical protein